MGEHFRKEEEEFITSITSVQKKIDALSLQTNHKKQVAFNDLKEDLTQCERNIKLMETEIASLPPQTKFQYIKKVRQYRKDFDNVRKSLIKAEEAYVLQKSRDKLIGAELEDGSQTRESKFIRQGEIISQGTNKLRDGVRVMHQTFQMSNQIEGELQSHTGRLIQNRKKMGGIGDQLTHSGKLVGTMMMRIRRNKFILFSVLGLIFLVAIIILGFYFSRRNKSV